MIKVMHVITTLGPAGAETMLCRIASGMDNSKFKNEVVSLTGILDLADTMEATGARVRTLGMKKGAPNPMLVMRLAQWIRESKPDVIHTWMYHANLIGAFAAKLAGNVPVVWSVHHSVLDPRLDKRRTMWVNRACALLSNYLPAQIVFCSQASLRIHEKLGYASRKLRLIPNGFDLDQAKPELGARESVRAELGIPNDTLLIAMVARFHPHKDHRNFVRAAQLLRQQMPDVHFLMCGMNVTWQNAELAGWIDAAGIRGRCHLLGARSDVPRLFSAADLATSASCNEAFPIAMGEAMACETPCVVTDVGDCALIVGDTGEVVPPGNPKVLAECWRKLLEAGPEARREMGIAARQRVQQRFALPAVVERYQELYLKVESRASQGTRVPSLKHAAR
jgi:glycosyltransferase involved in cell wall biosynthesis